MSRPHFSICICPDSRLLRDRLDALLTAHPFREDGTSGKTTPWHCHIFWGDEGLSSSFWSHLTLQGLFATPKALILRNAQLLLADSLKQLCGKVTPLASGQGSRLVWPLICLEVAFERGKPKIPAHILRLPLWKTAEEGGWITEIPGLTDQTLPAYIRSEAARCGLSLSPEEVRQFALAFPPDAAFIASELSRLSLLADSSGRLPEGSADLCAHSRELGIFELIRVVQMNRNAPDAWRRVLDDALSGEGMVFAVSSLLQREARQLWQCLSGPEPYLPPQVLREKRILAQTLGFAGIARLWEFALKADKGIKTGERSPDQALAMLTADLYSLFGSR